MIEKAPISIPALGLSTSDYAQRVVQCDADHLHYSSLIEELTIAYDEYIKVLGEEITELVLLADAHGWQSSRVEQGNKCRARIQTLKEAGE